MSRWLLLLNGTAMAALATLSSLTTAQP